MELVMKIGTHSKLALHHKLRNVFSSLLTFTENWTRL
jgi:hypothetical protein